MRPILERHFSDLGHAAALIGYGSEVLGYDDEQSQDHEWGPRVLLFLDDVGLASRIQGCLADELPTTFAGLSTHFGPTEEEGTRALRSVTSGPVAHRVELLDLGEFLRDSIGVDPRDEFAVADWLVTPSQTLAELTSGDVFVDPAGELTRVRQLLSWYPRDVWLLVMAGHWRRVAQLEHLMARAGSRGDELGSRVIAASLVRDLMKLALLQERRYPPYWKWLGAAYASLGRQEGEALAAVLEASEWSAREDALVVAYEAVARRHNVLAVTDPVDPTVRQFWGRPFRVLFADRFVHALRASVQDPAVRAVGHLAGSIDSVSDNTDVLTRASLWRELVGLYDRS